MCLSAIGITFEAKSAKLSWSRTKLKRQMLQIRNRTENVNIGLSFDCWLQLDWNHSHLSIAIHLSQWHWIVMLEYKKKTYKSSNDCWFTTKSFVRSFICWFFSFMHSDSELIHSYCFVKPLHIETMFKSN